MTIIKNVLKVHNLGFALNGKSVINGLNLEINEGEIHVLLGPNGSGKSTLAKILAGHPFYKKTTGTLLFNNKDLGELSPDKIAKEGLFLAFQQPIEFGGINNFDFFHLLYNKHLKNLEKKEIDPFEFYRILTPLVEKFKLPENVFLRKLNEGFSGGEKKKLELIQAVLIKPQLLILDEIDSGLDVDALKFVVKTIKHLMNKKRSLLLITHNTKLLQHLKIAQAHVLCHGKIVKSGDKEFCEQILKSGFSEICSNFK